MAFCWAGSCFIPDAGLSTCLGAPRAPASPELSQPQVPGLRALGAGCPSSAFSGWNFFGALGWSQAVLLSGWGLSPRCPWSALYVTVFEFPMFLLLPVAVGSLKAGTVLLILYPWCPV